MRNIMIKYSYDGTMFYGSQRQPGKRTVQGEIEKALFTITKEKIDMITAGRTDKGVHALMQVSNFFTGSVIPIDKLQYALQNALPTDINIYYIKEVSLDFHARYQAKSRAYVYVITSIKDPFTCRYKAYYKEKIDVNKLEKIMNIFIGKHDLSNFMLVDNVYRNTVREIEKIKVTQKNEKDIEIYIKGGSFLKSQVRIMVGMSLDVYTGRRSIEELIELLNDPSKKTNKTVAKAEGLYLSEVDY